MVFTTGAALRKSPERYLGGLAAAGALGVVVELAAGVPLAQSVKRPAEQLDLALVALRREIKFVEVTEEVHRRIVSEQFEEVAFDRRVHETFTDLSMKRVSAIGIVEATARMLDEPVVLEDLAHQAVAIARVRIRRRHFSTTGSDVRGARPESPARTVGSSRRWGPAARNGGG